MLDFLKDGLRSWMDSPPKKASATAVAEELKPPQVFKTGEQTQFRDPKTGEFVYQYPISMEHRKTLMESIQKNAQCANQFIALNRQRMNIDGQVAAVNAQINASEKEINDVITKVRDDLKLDKRWGLNMQLGVLERRDPPTG